MKIGRLLFLTVCLLLLGIASKSQVSKGEGPLKTDVRELSGFNEIIAQGSFELTLVQGEQEGLRIESDENLLELFQTRIEGKRLYISMATDIRKYTSLKVTVSFKELKRIVLLNEISLKTSKLIHFDDLEILAGGMSKINFEIFAAHLNLQIVDGCFAYFKGYAENLDAEIHDETELNAFDMQTDTCRILSSGLTEVSVSVQKDLKLTVSGGSNIYYQGEPTISERIFSSNGFIVKRKHTE